MIERDRQHEVVQRLDVLALGGHRRGRAEGAAAGQQDHRGAERDERGEARPVEPGQRHGVVSSRLVDGSGQEPRTMIAGVAEACPSDGPPRPTRRPRSATRPPEPTIRGRMAHVTADPPRRPVARIGRALAAGLGLGRRLAGARARRGRPRQRGARPGAAGRSCSAWSFDPTSSSRSSWPRPATCGRSGRSIGPIPATRCRDDPARSCWLLGLGAIVVALQSPIERYDTTLFSVHMVQHILLTLVAAPLLALGAPITLLLRFARPETAQAAGSCRSSTRCRSGSSPSRS